MNLKLPNDGLRFLSEISGTGILPVFMGILIALFMLSRNEELSLYNHETNFPKVKTYFLIIAISAWIALEFVGEFRALNNTYLFVFVRNSAGIILGFMIPIVTLSGNETTIRSLIGRVRPTAKLIMSGLLTFLGLGITLWGFSFIQPFQAEMPSINRIDSHFFIKILMTVFLIPLTEELLFRYYLYAYFRGLFGVICGILSVSLLFSLFHGLTGTTVAIFVGALLMNVLVEITRSILPSLILHGGFNGLLVLGPIWLQ
jgi:membrane protease YdiL (CAAX protease family)